MFTKDAETRYKELIGASSYELFPSGDWYVVGASIQQGNVSSNSEIRCNSTTFIKNYAKDFSYNVLSYHCDGAINIYKTGNDDATYVVTAIPADKYTSSSASVSGALDYDAYNISMGNSMYLLWIALGLIIMLEAIKIGTYIFKK